MILLILAVIKVLRSHSGPKPKLCHLCELIDTEIELYVIICYYIICYYMVKFLKHKDVTDTYCSFFTRT